MQVEIYIDDEKVDVSQDTQVAETKQVNDFFEVNDRQTSYTNTFKLPKTERNKSLMGGHSIPGVTSMFPYRTHKVHIFRNGLPTVEGGIGYLKDTDDSFNLYVYSENIDLFEMMKDKSIADLKINSLSHELNIENWLNSFNPQEKKKSAYIYAIADYGYTENDVIVVDFQVPSLFVSYVWNKIFAENNFKWKYVGRGGRNDYNPFIGAKWSNLAFTIDEGLQRLEESVNPIHKLQLQKDKISHYEGETITMPFTGEEIVINRLEGEITEYIKFLTVLDPDNIHLISTSSSSYGKTRIRIKEDGFYKIDINGFMYNHNTELLGLFIEKNGVEIFTINDEFPEDETQFGEELKLYLKQGDEIFVKVKSLPIDNESHYAYDINLDMFLDNSVNYVNFNSYLSKVKQKDFIKDIVNYLGLIYRKRGNTYEFISIEELLNPLAPYADYTPPESEIIEDWSDKFVAVEKEFTQIGKYAQSNLFRYKYINPNDTYANASIKVDDQTLQDEVTLIERIFKAPDRSTVLINNRQLRLCDLYKKEFDDDGNVKDIKPNKSSPFFFQVVKEETELKYKLYGTENHNTITMNVPFMRFSDLDFNNVLPEKYAAFSNMLTYGKKYRVKVQLSEIDVHKLDFFKLKAIKQLGGIFYLNKVNNFTGGEHTSVELIKVKVIERKGQFSDDFSSDFNI